MKGLTCSVHRRCSEVAGPWACADTGPAVTLSGRSGEGAREVGADREGSSGGTYLAGLKLHLEISQGVRMVTWGLGEREVATQPSRGSLRTSSSHRILPPTLQSSSSDHSHHTDGETEAQRDQGTHWALTAGPRAGVTNRSLSDSEACGGCAVFFLLLLCQPSRTFCTPVLVSLPCRAGPDGPSQPRDGRLSPAAPGPAAHLVPASASTVTRPPASH